MAKAAQVLAEPLRQTDAGFSDIGGGTTAQILAAPIPDDECVQEGELPIFFFFNGKKIRFRDGLFRCSRKISSFLDFMIAKMSSTYRLKNIAIMDASAVEKARNSRNSMNTSARMGDTGLPIGTPLFCMKNSS
ncbi:hypothetical protein M514_24342, partial [Trichuris suis]